MAQDEIIARRYAKGLAERAAETGEVDGVRRDLEALSAVMDPRSGDRFVPELGAFLVSPTIGLTDKLKAVESIASRMGVEQTVTDFFKLLVNNGRAGLLPHIHRAFGEVCAALTGEYTAVVETAMPLSADQKERLASVLSNVFGGVVRLHQQIEPGLLAGARIKVGDRTFDGSVFGKLQQLRGKLLTSGVDQC